MKFFISSFEIELSCIQVSILQLICILISIDISIVQFTHLITNIFKWIQIILRRLLFIVISQFTCFSPSTLPPFF